jgi:phospholipid/cholesterol/gamma-HCH transport system ATP-binding protein
MMEAVAERSGMAPPSTNTTPAVQLEHVSKAFGSRRVLDDVSLEVPAGSACVILGRSGTGKSVLLRHIIALVRPDSGRVFVQGREVSALTGVALSQVRRSVGFLFQNAALFDSISVGENVAFPLRRHTRLADSEIRSRAEQKLASVGLGHEYNKMPAALSGGMKKRAGLARALALDPQIQLVDEPSAGHDPITSDEIDTLLLELKQRGNTTILVVTHNIPSARKVGDELVMLHEGRIVARGTASELDENSNELVRAFMQSQHSG